MNTIAANPVNPRSILGFGLAGVLTVVFAVLVEVTPREAFAAAVLLAALSEARAEEPRAPSPVRSPAVSRRDCGSR